MNYRKSEVSSTNSLALVIKSLEIPLKYIKNNNSPSIDPWVTAASILLHEENCPFKATLFFQEFKKSVMISNRLPEIQFYSNLHKRPLCHTLLNALGMSKNTPRTSRPSSNDLYYGILFHE